MEGYPETRGGRMSPMSCMLTYAPNINTIHLIQYTTMTPAVIQSDTTSSRDLQVYTSPLVKHSVS